MRAGIYTRVSLDDGRQTAENQRQQIMEFSARMGWQVVAEFTDCKSGKNLDRPGFKAMMAAASKREFDVLVFWDLSRLSRSGVVDVLNVLQQLKGWGVAYRSLQEAYLDSLGSFSEVVVSLLASIARLEREKIRERTLAGLARARKAGRIGGRPKAEDSDSHLMEKVAALRENGNARPFNGLNSKLFNPVSKQYFIDGSGDTYSPFEHANATNMPNPDPEEGFDDVNYQLFGPEPPSQSPKWPNLGFVIDYAKVTGTNIPVQIMEPFSPEQVPVISALARNFAVSDAWFSSVPSDTWPNRSFFHSGTSKGHVVNGTHPDPLAWDVQTIFNVLEDCGVSWRVYSAAMAIPALTWLMSPKLWGFSLDRFRHFDDFKKDCASGSLPQYSFLEPSFVESPNDDHPPHDVVVGEQFLWEIWQVVSKSPAWQETLLLITYDEHGGTYDHVMPPWDAACPDQNSDPGEEGFTFNRFGVRVPMVAVSPWIQAGTVFRSDSAVPYDHTSMLATLRDWLSLPAEKMLTSKRVASAPNLGQILTLDEPRTDVPDIPAPAAEVKEMAMFLPPNTLQKSMVSAQAVKHGHDLVAVLESLKTRHDARAYLQANT